MKKLDGCIGCEDEPYWHGLGGQHECWSAGSAKPVERLSSPDEREQLIQDVLDNATHTLAEADRICAGETGGGE